MQSAIRAAIEYIEESRKAGTSEDQMASITTNRIENLKSMLGKSTPSIQDSTAAIAIVGSALVFSTEQKNALLTSIHTKMQDGSDQTVEEIPSNKSQSNRYVEHYVTASLYDILEDKEKPEDERVEAFVDFLQLRNGCKFPDVPTRKRVVGVILLANGAKVTARGAKACYDLFAKINIMKRKFREHVPTTMRNFPQSPKDFMLLHPTLYVEGDPPVPNRYASSMIDEVVGMTSARNTNNLLKSDALDATSLLHLPAGDAFRGATQANQMNMMGMMSGMQQCVQMMGQMFNMQHGGGMPPRGSGGGPTITYRYDPWGQRQVGDGQPRLEGNTPPGQSSPGSGSRPTNEHGVEHEAYDDSSNGTKTPKGANVDTRTSPDQDEADDIDKMIGKGLAKPPRKKAMKGKKAIKDAKIDKKLPAAKSKVKKTIDATSASHKYEDFPRAQPPKFGTKLPCVYNGCKIYGCQAKYRVLPFPGKSPYDKPFHFKTGGKQAAWKDAIAYCKNPKIPATSKNALDD